MRRSRPALRTLHNARLRRRLTDAQCHAQATRIAALACANLEQPLQADGEARIEAPFWRGGSPCFYDGRQKVVESHLRVGGVPLARPIRSTHLEPGVTIVCRTRAQFDAEAARHGYLRYNPRTGQAW